MMLWWLWTNPSLIHRQIISCDSDLVKRSLLTEAVKIFRCTKRWTSQAHVWMWIPNPKPAPVSILLVRSAASMAALTFRPASSETEQVPLTSQIFPHWQVCVRCVPSAPGDTQDICGFSFIFWVHVCPQFCPQQTLVQGSQEACWWLCGEPGMKNISPLCLHGNIWPSICLSACMSVWLTGGPSHIVAVCRSCCDTSIFTHTGLIPNSSSMHCQNKQAKCHMAGLLWIINLLIQQLCVHH